MLYTDHVRRSGCHEVLIENDTDGPHSDGPHDGPRTVQHRIVAYGSITRRTCIIV